jgi:hypothetical protein
VSALALGLQQSGSPTALPWEQRRVGRRGKDDRGVIKHDGRYDWFVDQTCNETQQVVERNVVTCGCTNHQHQHHQHHCNREFESSDCDNNNNNNKKNNISNNIINSIIINSIIIINK